METKPQCGKFALLNFSNRVIRGMVSAGRSLTLPHITRTWGLSSCCFWADDLFAHISKVGQDWGHTVDALCDSSLTLIQIRKLQSALSKDNHMSYVLSEQMFTSFIAFVSWSSRHMAMNYWTVSSYLLLWTCLFWDVELIACGCFSELYLPGAESGHLAPEQNRRVCSDPNQQRCGDDRVADVQNQSVPPPRLVWAVDLTRQNKQSLTEPDRRVYSGGLSGETHICESGDRLSVIYNMRLYSGSTQPTIPQFIDPAQEDLIVCVCERSGTMNSQAPLGPDKDLG